MPFTWFVDEHDGTFHEVFHEPNGSPNHRQSAEQIEKRLAS